MWIFSFYVTRAFDWCIETYVLYKILCKTWKINSHFMCQKKYTRELTKGSNHPIPPEKLTWTIAKGKATGKFGFIRFGCGFLHWFNFFTEYFSNNVFKVIRHTLHGELTMKLKNIWWSIITLFELIFSQFFQHLSMQMSSFWLCMILMTGVYRYGYIYSW